MSTRERAKKIFDLYRKYGDENYIGEEVSQREHASQCAVLARQEGHPDSVVLGAFLHDIGHLLQEDDQDHMVTNNIKLGVKDHDKKGEQFLSALGIPAVVSDIARGHVDAKRYLCYKDQQYYENLSPASKMTLEHQGGKMTKDEADLFESNPNCEVIIRARKWDEGAKVPNMKLPPISYFEELMVEYLSKVESTQ